MLFAVRALRESPAAVITLERPQAQVNAFVAGDVATLVEPLGTKRTGQRVYSVAGPAHDGANARRPPGESTSRCTTCERASECISC